MGAIRGATRRDFLIGAGGGVLLAGCQGIGRGPKAMDEQDDKVTPGEDLMQEHGVLKRLLLVYGEAIRRIQVNQEMGPEAIADAAGLVRSFVEEYHEQQEEKYVFSRLKSAGKVVDVVQVLLEQHQAGRRVTDRIVVLATAQGLRDVDSRRELVERMGQFIRMYSVHEAREDTIVIPAFRDLVSKQEYEALGAEFEKNEHRHFGADGFDMAVDKVAKIEKTLGIYDLAQFTPRI